MGSWSRELPELPQTVPEALRVLRRATGMNHTEFAAAISQRTGRVVNRPNYSNNEYGVKMPLADTLLAAIHLAATISPELYAEAHPITRGVERLQATVEEMSRWPEPLDWADVVYDREPDDCLTILEASRKYDVSREIIYTWGELGKLPGYKYRETTFIHEPTVRQLAQRANAIKAKRRPRSRRKVVKVTHPL